MRSGILLRSENGFGSGPEFIFLFVLLSVAVVLLSGPLRNLSSTHSTHQCAAAIDGLAARLAVDATAASDCPEAKLPYDIAREGDTIRVSCPDPACHIAGSRVAPELSWRTGGPPLAGSFADVQPWQKLFMHKWYVWLALVAAILVVLGVAAVFLHYAG